MATIGEMLRLDSDGRFRSSGRGPKIEEEAKRREKDEVSSIPRRNEGTPEPEEREGARMQPQPAYRYVTRDGGGMYLGAYTPEEAKAVWPAAKRHGLIICVPGKVPAKGLAGTLNGRHDKPDAASSAVLRRSARKAIAGSLSALSKGLDPHCNPSSPSLKCVFNRGEVPICMAPLDMVERIYGSGWFFVDDSTVQLVTTFSGNELKRLCTDAQRRYETDHQATPSQQPTPEMKETSGEIGHDTSNDVLLPESPPYQQSTQEKRSPDDQLYFARDAKGLYLGIHKLGWTRSLQDVPYVDQGVIVLPKALATRKAASLSGRVGKKTLKALDRNLHQVIKRSESYIRSIPRVTSEEFWSRQDERLVKIYSLNATNLGSLTPPQLRELFGNGWFLVSSDVAQLTVPVDNDIIRQIRKLESEDRAAIDAKVEKTQKAWENARHTRGMEPSENNSEGGSAGHAQTDAVPRDATPAFMRLILSLGIGEEHARAIYDQVMLVARHGYRSKLTGTLRSAFPTDPVRLPSGRELEIYIIAIALARRNGQSLAHEDRDFVLLALDRAMTESERLAEEERRATDEYLEQAKAHKHTVTRWMEATLQDPNADAESRELAEVFERRQGVVLVMQAGELCRSVLSTDMDDEAYACATPYLPFTHFIVRVPGIKGVYGFGAVRNPGGSGVRIVAIPEGGQSVDDVETLLPFFKRVLFFICANRDFSGGAREYFDQARSRATRSTAGLAQPGVVESQGRKGSAKAVVQGKSFDIGVRVIFLSEGPDFKQASSSGSDIRPHAVAGTTYVMGNGTEVVRRPYWNHGAGNKRNALPPEIVERNIRYRDGA